MKQTLFLTALLLAPLAGLTAAEPAKPNILHIHADDHRPDGLHALGNPLLADAQSRFARRARHDLHALLHDGLDGRRGLHAEPHDDAHRPLVAAHSGGPGRGTECRRSRDVPAASHRGRRLSDLAHGQAGQRFPGGLQEFETSIIDDAKGKTPETDRAHCSQRLADRTIEFLKSRAASHEARPFYIYLAPPVPHDPRSAEPQFHKLYDPAKIPLSPAFLPLHPFDNGEMTVRDEKLAPWPRTPRTRSSRLADYYACVTGLDHHVGRIFAELKASGQWDNTIIIFSGDNGLSLGEHGLFGKQNLYEFGGMHVPLVIAGPGIPKGRSEALVYLMDLFPTFAEFAGAKIPDGVEGKSLVPILTGKQTKVRDVLYTGYRDCQRAIRDDRWKLIRYPLVDRTQLFDLSTDPHELNNLADKPEHAAKVAEMTALLTKEMASHADTFPLTVANPKPAEWSPPAPGARPANPVRNKAKE